MASIQIGETLVYNESPREVGEVWTINGGTLLIQTDTRWHQNSPAGMVGTLSNITFHSGLGGNLQIYGSGVKWIPFNNGTGTVPAVNSYISQSPGGWGYLLGVWSSLTSAPSAVGSAMPATGFLKFINADSIYVGVLTGIGADATGDLEVGWIEVVADQSMNIFTYRGMGYDANFNIYITGDWFKLGVTDGTAGQTFQVPTNGGGAGTYVSGIYVGNPYDESGEWYPVLSNSDSSFDVNIGTDIRNKVAYSAGSGLVRLGSDGTNTRGYTPPAGLNVYVPNIFLRQCTTAARATNVVPSTTWETRPEITAGYMTRYLIENVCCDWAFLSTTTTQPIDSFYIKNSTFAESVSVASMLGEAVVTNSCVGRIVSYNSGSALAITGASKGHITNSVFVSKSSITVTLNSITPNTYGDFYIDGCKTYKDVATSTDGVNAAIQLNNCINIDVKDIHLIKGYLYLSGSQKIQIRDLDYCSKMVGATATTSTTTHVGVRLNTCDHILIDGITFGFGNTVNGCMPYQRIFHLAYCYNVKIRNLGTYTTSHNPGTNYPRYLLYLESSNEKIELARIYCSQLNAVVYTSTPRQFDIVLNDVMNNSGGGIGQISGVRNQINNCLAPSITNNTASDVIDTVFYSMFLTTNKTQINLSFNTLTAMENDLWKVTGQYKNYDSGRIYGDFSGYLVFEMKYAVPLYWSQIEYVTLTGGSTTNFLVEVEADWGTGWQGYKTAAEVASDFYSIGDSTVPIKVRVRISYIGTEGNRLSSYLSLIQVGENYNNYSYINQENLLLPLSTFSMGGTEESRYLVLFNLVEGSTISIYRASDYGVVASTNSCFSIFEYEYTWEQNVNVTVEVSKTGYENFNVYNVILTDESMMLPINQVAI